MLPVASQTVDYCKVSQWSYSFNTRAFSEHITDNRPRRIRLQARNITPIPAMNIKLFEARLPQHEDVVRIGKDVCSTGAYVEFVQVVLAHCS